MGGTGAATVVIAHHDPRGRELLARIVEAMGQNAVRSDVGEAPTIVDRTVGASALVVVLDIGRVDLAGLAEVIDTFAARRYPAQVVALVDGPASATRAGVVGAAVALVRPFHSDVFEAELAALLGLSSSAPATSEVDVAESPVDDRTADAPADPGGATEGTSEPDEPAPAGPTDEDPTPEGSPDDEPLVDMPAGNVTAGDDSDEAPSVANAERLDRDGPTESSGSQDESSGSQEGRAPVPTTSRDSASTDSFTDILRMGRQL